MAIFSLMFSCLTIILGLIETCKILPDTLPSFNKEELDENPLINGVVSN